jgi:hypothetical protein
VEDAAAGATLAAEGSWSWAELTWQAVAGYSGNEDPQIAVKTYTFKAPAGAKLTLRRGFPMMGPVDILQGVTIEPEQLAPGQEDFTLHTGRSVCRGGTYVVEVEATTDDGTREVVLGWITVL